jgi:DNA-binding Lrp family transcriptional regulator
MSNKREPPFIWLTIRQAGQSLNISKSSVRRIMEKMKQDDVYKYGVFKCDRIVRIREDLIMDFVLKGNVA